MKYHFKIHKERKGYWAECIELEGCMTQGSSKEDLLNNMSEALNLFLSEPTDSKHLFSHPKNKISGKNVVQVEVQSSVAIANRIREVRIKNDMTQQKMKEFLGIKNLSNYQRLEDPSKSNPEWSTLMLIKSKFPQFKVDDLLK